MIAYSSAHSYHFFFLTGGAVDYAKLAELVESQIADGVSGIVPMGTTGECPTVSHEEHEKIVATVVKAVNGRVPVIAGTGSNCTTEALRLTRHAKECGATACLMVNPYYNKPTQEGLYQHYKKVAEVGLPIVLYNIPGRTGITMSAQTVARLYNECPEIVAIKEATGSLDLATEIASLCDITILSGDDGLTLPLMSIGAKGVVSVLSNFAPKEMLAIVDAVNKGDLAAAVKQHVRIFQLCKTMFCETNPQPVKYAMQCLGILNETCRLPLTSCLPENKKKVEAVLAHYGFLGSNGTK